MEQNSVGDAYKVEGEPEPKPETQPQPQLQPRPATDLPQSELSHSAKDADAHEFEDIELQSNAGDHVADLHPRRGRQWDYFSAMGWWTDEYFYASVCVVTAGCLGVFLDQYDNHVVPETLFWGIQIDTVIIALITVVRVSLKAFVESAVSQGAWIWVSQASQMRCKHEAKLADFKLFDEASRGL